MQNKRKINYRSFLYQILYLNRIKKLSPKEIRCCLKLSGGKIVVPSTSVIFLLNFLTPDNFLLIVITPDNYKSGQISNGDKIA